MKNRLLSFVLSLVVAGFAYAQTWTAPEQPTEASDPISGHVYRVKNVESGFFLAGGASWYSWATSTILVDAEASEPLTFTLTETFDAEGNSTGWTFARTSDGKYTFLSGTSPASLEGYGEMHVDMASQGHNYFEIIKQENGNYHIRAVASDDTYGSAMEGYENKCWGWAGYESDYQFAVYGTVDATSEDPKFYCDWQFIDFSVYQAKMDLYNLTATVDSEDLGIDYSGFEEAYNSNDLDAINNAISELNAQIAQARVYAVFKFGQDGENPPSRQNPADGTSLIKNNDFSAGNHSGWTCTFKSGENATNVGYQGNQDYTNGDIVVSKFIEAWAAKNTNFNPGLTYSAIGDGELSQTMPGLPAGLYRLSADCIAVQQYQSDANPVTGVQLFATGGEEDTYEAISTGNGAPEHFELTFVSTGGDVTLGLRTDSCTANWIAADNFQLWYYGNEGDPQQLALQTLIESIEAKYPDLSEVHANAEVVAAFEQQLADAQDVSSSVDGDYAAAKTTLEANLKVFETSVADYEVLKGIIDACQATMDQVDASYPDLSGEIADYKQGLEEAYYAGSYTAEDIAAEDGKLSQIIAAFISENCKPGDDITILLTNPSFDEGSARGWTATGTAPAFAAYNAQGENTTGTMNADYLAEVGESDPTTWGMNCEVYHAAFDLSQTIKNMPAGLYKFTCQGFWRGKNENGNDTDDKAGELYAVLGDGSVQTDPLANLNDCATEDQLYANGGWGDDQMANNGAGYVPFCMSGAMYHFHHKNDGENYDYTSTLNIILTEPSDITVGVRTTSKGTWVIFDNFRITYMGSGTAVYQEAIEEGIAAVESYVNSGEHLFSADVVASTDDAINGARDVIDNIATATEEEAIASIANLKAALEAAKTNAALLDKFVAQWTTTNDYRMGLVESSDAEYPAFIDEMGSYATGDEIFETAAAVEEAMVKMNTGFTKFVQFDHLDATESEPADISAVICNPDYTYYGQESSSAKDWNQAVGSIGWGNSEGRAAEVFNQAFDVNQTIYGLAPGYYQLGVLGFYRDGLGSALADSLANGVAEDLNVELYAGETSTKLLPITHNMAEFTQICTDNGITSGIVAVTLPDDETTYSIPDDAANAATAIEAALYQNVLQFQVVEGQESVTIGLRKEALVTDDWTIFNNWTLKYLGTAEPTVDPTTSIAGVENAAPVALTIYNLAGQRVSKAVKGLYIINGKKVMVK